MIIITQLTLNNTYENSMNCNLFLLKLSYKLTNFLNIEYVTATMLHVIGITTD